MADIRLAEGWKRRLAAEFEQPAMQALAAFLRAEKAAGKRIYPPSREIFAALDAVAPEDVKVVVLGQDPYHGPGQAHGLSFSVRPGVPPPPSLVNIFTEIESDLGIARPDHGCLLPWARQGVLLLNAVLTVEDGRPGSHQGRGWEGFTDAIVAGLSSERENLVFLLWGSYAQRKGAVIDRHRHLVLAAPHPSPLSAHRGFFGCRHFSRTNAWLKEHGMAPIDWTLPRAAELPALGLVP
jgi:uracil-DNA glycosylase